MKVSIKAMRVNAGLTQEAAAEQLGITKQTLANWEKNETSPNVKMLSALCRLYGCDVGDIFLPGELAKS